MNRGKIMFVSSADWRINSNTHFSFNSLFLCFIISRNHSILHEYSQNTSTPKLEWSHIPSSREDNVLDLSRCLYRLISHHGCKWLCKIPLFILFYNTQFSYSCPKPGMWSCTLSPAPNLQYSTFHAFLTNEAQPLAKIPNHVQNSNCPSKDI